jgi:hypothetical protein
MAGVALGDIDVLSAWQAWHAGNKPFCLSLRIRLGMGSRGIRKFSLELGGSDWGDFENLKAF